MALDNVETFQANYAYCRMCGSLVFYDHRTDEDGRLAADCGDCHTTNELTLRGWFYWYCLPGCLPDSEPFGPFAAEAEALADAQEQEDEDAAQRDDDEDKDDPQEPEEDDITTPDHAHFYQYRREAFEVVETVDGEYLVLVKGVQIGGKRDRSGAGDATFSTVEDAIRAYMEHEQFWSNVWFISDRGNAHLIAL